MAVRDVAYLLLKPFHGAKRKGAAAQLSQVVDDMLHSAFEVSNDCGFNKRQKGYANFDDVKRRVYAVILQTFLVTIRMPKTTRNPGLPELSL